MEYNIFKDEKEKNEARQSLPELMKHPGWKFIVKALDANAAYTRDQLQKRKDFSSLDELYALQDRIDDLEQYKELPANILVELVVEDPEVEPDIY